MHAIIDHELLVARFEIIGVCVEWRPDDVRLAFWFEIGAGAFLKTNAAPIFSFQAEVRLIPGRQFLRIVRFEKDSADANDAFHLSISSTAA